MEVGLDTQSQLSALQVQLSQAVAQAQLAAQEPKTDRPSPASTLAISTTLSTDTLTLRTVINDFARATSMVQTGSAALDRIETLLEEAAAKVAPAAESSAMADQDRTFINVELQNLLEEIDNIANTTTFNDVPLLDGNGGEVLSVANPLPDLNATENVAFSYTIPANTFYDPEGDELNYNVTLAGGEALPSWLSFDEGTRTFSGTPTTDDIGSLSLVISATDTGSGLSVSDNVLLTVNPDTGLVINGTVGNDTLNGTASNDTINGSSGNDLVNAGAGRDSITLEANLPGTTADDLPVTGDLVLRLDAGNTADINTHPGNVTFINDQSAFNNDITNDVGNVASGSDTINGINSLTFDGSSFLQVADTGDINLGNNDQRSVFVAFETGADINTRQVIYEQGGGTNGYNIYIENGQIYVGAWRGNGGTFSLFESAAITANSTNVVGFVFDSTVTNSFTGYLNGASIGSSANSTAMANHSGDIGIGGRNNATRYHNGNAGGDGDEFIGEIGELLNYRDALTAGEAANVQTYLLDRFVTPVATDTVEGGAGVDTLTLTTNPVELSLSAASDITGVETISLAGNNNDHSITVDDGYFTAGSGVDGGTLTIDSSGIANGIEVDGSGVTGNLLEVLTGSGDDTITGGGNANTKISFAAAGAVNVNLFSGTATGDGNDTLNNVRNVEGSSNGDNITGSGEADTISGGDGDDVIGDIVVPAGSITTDNLVAFLDATVLGDIATHPGTVSSIQDQSAFNNDFFSDTGNVLSGSDDINGLNSLTFDGSSFLRMNDDADINTSNANQRSAFVSFETGADVTTRQVIYEQGGQVNGFNIYIEGGQLIVGAWKNNGSDFSIFHSTAIEANSTNIAGFVFDFTGSDTFAAYLNGQQFGSTAVGIAQSSHGGDIGIGGYNNDTRYASGGAGGDGDEFTGEIGELLLYRDALSGGEIIDLNNFLINRRFNVEGGDDLFTGGAGDDTITGGGGNDTIEGGDGDDVAVYDGNIADYTVTDNGDGTYTVADNRVGNPEGTDLIRDRVETLQFADGTVALSYNTAPTIDLPAGPFNVSEDAANGTSLGTLTSTDPDVGDTLTYSITGGNTGGVFAIDANTGEITVADNTTLDLASLPFYDLTVRVTDDGTGNLFHERDVRINVISAEPTQPTLSLQSHTENERNLGIPVHDARTSSLFSGASLDVSTQALALSTQTALESALDAVREMQVLYDASQFTLDTARELAQRDAISFQQAFDSLRGVSETDSSRLELMLLIQGATASSVAQFNQLEEQITESLFA